MRIAHLILVHKNAEQVQRLINALDHPRFDFYIHLDLKTDESNFVHLEKEGRITFIRNRVSVEWGCYSLVQAQLNGMMEIVAAGKYDYINILSAQDYPVYSADYIYNFFLRNAGTEFISLKTFEDDPVWWSVARQRVEKYHFHNWKVPGKFRMQFLVNRILPVRRYPVDHVFAGRSQWFSITTACAKYILDFLAEHPEIVRFYKYVWGADEFIFSTIVMNSEYKKNAQDHLVYIDWSENKARPKLLTTKDFDAIVQSGKLFARKFDLEEDANIFTLLENWARGKTLVH